MFDLLTKYLVQYKQVCIPFVGTIQLVQQPAQLNVADKTIHPPSFVPELKNRGAVSDHQLQFLATALAEEKESVSYSLHQFGNWFKDKIAGDGYDWKGIGLIRSEGSAPAIFINGLEPVAAARVLRTDAEHSVLVGDQQMTSTQIAGLKEESFVRKETSLLIIIGWVLLFLSILYIVFVLYRGNFNVGATGSKQAPTSFVVSPSWGSKA